MRVMSPVADIKESSWSKLNCWEPVVNEIRFKHKSKKCSKSIRLTICSGTLSCYKNANKLIKFIVRLYQLLSHKFKQSSVNWSYRHYKNGYF